MWGSRQNVSATLQGGPRQAPAGGKVHPDPHGDMVCCGRPMEARLAHARDRFGQTMFVAVWRCLTCGRLAY